MRAQPIAMLPILLTALAVSAAAQERQWIAHKAPEGIEVMYGTPESDDVLFAIRCDAQTGEVFVGFAHEPVAARPGDAIDLVLFSEAGEIALPATVSYLDAMDITLIETPDVASADLRPILTGGQTLGIRVEDGAEEIPLAGTTRHFSDLLAACGL